MSSPIPRWGVFLKGQGATSGFAGIPAVHRAPILVPPPECSSRWCLPGRMAHHMRPKEARNVRAPTRESEKKTSRAWVWPLQEAKAWRCLGMRAWRVVVRALRSAEPSLCDAGSSPVRGVRNGGDRRLGSDQRAQCVCARVRACVRTGPLGHQGRRVWPRQTAGAPGPLTHGRRMQRRGKGCAHRAPWEARRAAKTRMPGGVRWAVGAAL